MRLVLVHGINNENKSERIIIDQWLDALSYSLSPADLAVIRKAEIIAPYYGDILYEAVRRQSAAGPQPVAQSAAGAPDDEADFYRDVLDDMAPAAGLTTAVISEQVGTDEATELGPTRRALFALVRGLERVSPFKGSLILRFLPQAFVYLHRDSAATIEGIVRPPLMGTRCVVVGHSLGTIVTYKLLRSEAAARAPFYLTLGSPLAVAAVKNAIGPLFERPDTVSRWLNGLDADDPVTIGRALTNTNFGPGIENIVDIDNGDSAHDICIYLRDRRIAETLVKELRSM
jgi:hypothetical protein